MIIAIINGPNLNKLGTREPKIYGNTTLKELEKKIRESFPRIDFIFFQSNHEGELIDFIQELDVDGIVINPGGYSHTSISILDALLMHSIPKVEVHISDIKGREEFRRSLITAKGCDEIISGMGVYGYEKAIKFISNGKGLNV